MWHSKKAGFTMIELVVVIAILGILAALAIPKYIDLTGKAEEATCEANRGAIESACAIYYASIAAGGDDAAFPATYNDPDLYADAQVPSCPTGGAYTYAPATGRITSCGNHP